MPVLETKQLARLLKCLPQKQIANTAEEENKKEEDMTDDSAYVIENLENNPLDDE